MLDDYDLILANDQINNFNDLYKLFIPDINKYSNIEEASQSPYYRPFAHIFPILCYVSFGKNVFVYHLIYLILYFIYIISIYFLIKELFSRDDLAILASFLYAIHPLNTSFVNYLAVNFTIQALSLCCALLLLLKYLKSNRFLQLAGSIIFYALSLLSHESSFIFLFIAIPTALYLKDKQNYTKLAKTFVPYIIISIIYFLFRINYSSLKLSIFDKISSDKSISLFSYLLTNLKLLFWHLSKYFVLNGIVIKWSTNPVTSGHWTWLTLFVFLFLILIYSFLKNDRIISWGISFYLIGFMPVLIASSYELRYGFLIEPHWLFFSSIGIFIVLSEILIRFREFISNKIYPFIIIITIIYISLQTYRLNKTWGNEVEYCKYWLNHSPNQKVATYFLASAYMRNGMYKEAENYFNKSLEGSAIDWKTYTNLALIFEKKGELNKALKHLNKANNLNPKSSTIKNNIGVLYQKLNQNDKAKYYYLKAIKLNSYKLEPRLNLALIYEDENLFDEALSLYLENINISPGNEPSLMGMIRIYLRQKNIPKINDYIQNILKRNYSSDFYFTNALLFAKNLYNKQSLQLFEKAITLDPNNSNIYIELGKLFANINQKDSAVNMWEIALKLGANKRLINDLIQKVNKQN